MPSHQSQNQTKETGKTALQDTEIMLKLAELLMQDNLITPEEKFRLSGLIRKGDVR